LLDSEFIKGKNVTVKRVHVQSFSADKCNC
jgi:hypothetical protein